MMEFKELFQLAKGNSSLAKRKSQKLNGDGRDANVSSSAVALFLERQKREKELQIKAEQEAKRKRIEARLNANVIGKKETVKEKQKPVNEVKSKPKTHKEHPRNGESSEVIKGKKKENEHKDKIREKHKEKHKHSEKSRADVKLDKHKIEHRKERERTEKSSKRKHAPENNGLSFMDLMKLAKSNSENPGSGTIQKKSTQPKPSTKTSEDVLFDPDRHIKIKRKHKDVPAAKPPPSKQAKNDSNKKKVDKLDKRNHPLMSDKKHQGNMRKDYHKNINPRQIASKDICRSELAEPPKHGLLVETISVSKNQSLRGIEGKNGKIKHLVNKRNDDRRSGIAAQSRDGKRNIEFGGIAAQNRSEGGIGAQNKGQIGRSKMKKRAEDYEDEFEKEEKELAKKRKLFEMRRRTGNMNLQMDELYDYDDYDLDEDDEDDDFIDDTGQGGDYSRHIRQIFGYDRRRYDDSDSDLDNMESNWNQIEKEEARSARIAKIEDEYEKMKEEEELEKIKARKKRK